MVGHSTNCCISISESRHDTQSVCIPIEVGRWSNHNAEKWLRVHNSLCFLQVDILPIKIDNLSDNVCFVWGLLWLITLMIREKPRAFSFLSFFRLVFIYSCLSGGIKLDCAISCQARIFRGKRSRAWFNINGPHLKNIEQWEIKCGSDPPAYDTYKHNAMCGSYNLSILNYLNFLLFKPN